MEQVALEAAIAEFVQLREAAEESGSELPDPTAFASRFPAMQVELCAALARLLEAEDLLGSSGTQEPKRIGPYRVLGELGRGGMGCVYRVVKDGEPGRPYALKLLGLAAQLNPRLLKRFQREADCIKGLRHPGIVRVHELGPPDGEPYLVMDLVEGVNLARVIASARSVCHGELPAQCLLQELPLASRRTGWDGVRYAVEFAASLARATSVLHDHGVLHRDIKPSNVVIQADGQPVLVDFGLAREGGSSSLTLSGDLLGTPHYMAPEQARGDELDERVDVYAIGALLYELLSLELPHAAQGSAKGKRSDPLFLLESIRKRPLRPIRSAVPALPGALARIVDRATAFRKGSRYTSAAALAADLEAFAVGKPIQARSMFLERTWLSLGRRRAALGIAALVLLLISTNWWLPRVSEVQAQDPGVLVKQGIDRAAMAWGLGDLEGTREAAESVLELEPGNDLGEFLLVLSQGSTPVDSEDPSIEALIYGLQRSQEGLPRQARAEFRRAAQLNPASPLPMVMSAKLTGNEGELEAQELELAEALDRDPDSAALSLELGRVLYQLERFPESLDALSASVAIDPDYARSYFDLARSQAKVEGFEAGLETVRAAALRFGSAGDRELRRFCNYLISEKQYALARTPLIELTERHPREAGLHAQVARTYDFEERIPEALQWYGSALAIKPGHVESRKALLHIRTGANRATCAQCAAAFATDPSLYDLDEALEHGLAILDETRGRGLGLTLWIVDKLGADFPEELGGKLFELLETARTNSEREVLERALESLESLTPHGG